MSLPIRRWGQTQDIWQRVEVSDPIRRTSKDHLPTEGRAIPDGSGPECCPLPNRAQNATCSLERSAELVPVRWNRTSVHRVQNGDPATERYRHGVSAQNRTEMTAATTLRLAIRLRPHIWSTHEELNPVISVCSGTPLPSGSGCELAPVEGVEPSPSILEIDVLP